MFLKEIKREGFWDLETTTPNWKALIPKDYKKTRAEFITDYYKTHPNPQVWAWGFLVPKENKNNKIKVTSSLEIGVQDDDEATFYYGININDFIKLLINQEYSYKLYSHNGKGWDNHFLLPAFVELNIKQTPKEKPNFDDDIYKEWPKEKLDKLKAEVKERERKLALFYDDGDYDYTSPLPYEFSAMIEKGKKIFKITLFFLGKGRNKGRLQRIEFEDNLLLIPSSVERMGEDLKTKAIAHGMDEAKAELLFSKQKINYFQDYTFNSLEELVKSQDGKALPYLKQDVYIVYLYRKELFNAIKEYGIDKEDVSMTIASTSMNIQEKILGNKLINYYSHMIVEKQKGIKQNTRGKIVKYVGKNGLNIYYYKGRKIYGEEGLRELLIEWLLPTTWLLEKDEFTNISRWYSGGLTRVNETSRGRVLTDVVEVDVVSMYPSIMCTDLPIPVGRPVAENVGNYHLYEVTALKNFDMKQGWAFLQLSSFDIDDEGGLRKEYLNHIHAGDTFRLTSPEYETMMKYCEIDESYVYRETKYSFKSMPANFLFKEYYDIAFAIKNGGKKTKNKILQDFGKLLCNSLYGKYGQKLKHVAFRFNEETFDYDDVTENSKSIRAIEVACAITSYSRLKLSSLTGFDVDRDHYTDTDAHIINESLLLEIKNDKRVPLGDKLGEWEVGNPLLNDETKWHTYNGIVRRPKQYYFECSVNGKECKECKKPLKIAYAGINFDKLPPEYENDEDFMEVINYSKVLTIEDFVYGKAIDNQPVPKEIIGGGKVLYENVKDIKPIWQYEPLAQQITKTKEEFILLFNATITNIKPKSVI